MRGPGFKPRENPLDSQSKLTKTKNWEDRAGSLVPVRSVRREGMRTWADEQVGVIPGPGIQEQVPQRQLLLVDPKARMTKIPGTVKWEVPDGNTQEIMSQG